MSHATILEFPIARRLVDLDNPNDVERLAMDVLAADGAPITEAAVVDLVIRAARIARERAS